MTSGGRIQNKLDKHIVAKMKMKSQVKKNFLRENRNTTKYHQKSNSPKKDRGDITAGSMQNIS